MASKAAETNTNPAIDGDTSTVTQGQPLENVIQGEFGIPKGGIKAATIRRTEVLHIDPRRFQIEPGWNTRNMLSADTRDHVKGLQASISEILPETGKPRGVVTPLSFTQKDGAWVIRSGHCRYAAVMAAIKTGVDIPTIPVMRASDNEREQAISQFTDNNGLPFTPIERGAHYKMLRDQHDMDITEIGKAIGKTASHVSQCIGYHDALSPHADIMEMIDAGYVSVAFAKDILDENDRHLDTALYILRGAVDIAMRLKANKAMPKHARMVMEQHKKDHPELYADETGGDTETGGETTTEEEVPASAPAGGKASGRGKAPAGATKAGSAAPAASVSRSEKTEQARDEICLDIATLMNKPAFKKKLCEIFGDQHRGKVDRFIAGAINGKWELPG